MKPGTPLPDACPHCGDENPQICFPASGAPPYVLCKCGAAGAQKKTGAEAIAAWNRRASNSYPKLVEAREALEAMVREFENTEDEECDCSACVAVRLARAALSLTQEKADAE